MLGADLRNIIENGHWISYAPTNYFPAESPPVFPSDESIQSDLRTIREAGFTGLITYGAQVEAIPRIAEAVGFRAMILGIWDPFSTTEKAQALRAVQQHHELIASLIVGNEGLSAGRYDVDALCEAMKEIRNLSGKPVSTTEPVDWLLSEHKIGQCSSFVTVSAHPFFSGRKEPQQAVKWTSQAWEAVRRLYPGKPLLFKEVGLPTNGDTGLSQLGQKEYYTDLAKTSVVFSYFEAFDATPRFKSGLIEQSWGLWTSDRMPKAIVAALPWRTIRR